MAMGIVVGTVIGSGVFKKGQVVASNVSEFSLVLLVWVLGGVLALLGALSLSEIAVLFPRAGGNYEFLKEAYGRLFGFLWGWVDFWIIRTASIAALATMFSEGLAVVLKESMGSDVEVLDFWPRQIISVLTILVLATINCCGTRLGAGVQLFLTLLKVGSILGIILLPFIIVLVVPQPAHPPTVRHLAPFWPSDFSAINWGKVGAALVGVLWAYHGWMNIGPVAEEVRNPQRNIPISLLGGVFVLITLYVGANVAYSLVIPRLEMAGLPRTTTVATEFCFRLLGPIGAILGSAIIMTSVFGSLNGNLLVGPRLLFAMARDRLAPTALANINAKTQTPITATVVLAVWSCILILGFGMLIQHVNWFDTDRIAANGLPEKKSPFDALTDFAMFGSVSFETLVVASLFIFRRRFPRASHPLPYRCPGYPIVPALYVLIMCAVLANMFLVDQQTESIIGVAFILVGALVYAILSRFIPALPESSS
jgi:basic amino acid/polyamine antiporter, APA family